MNRFVSYAHGRGARLTAHWFVAVIVLIGILGIQPSTGAQAAPTESGRGGRPGRPFLVPTAVVALGVPTEVMVGENFTFTATFDNTSPITTDVGYGPFIDIVFPVIGIDGAGAQIDDGISFVSATYLGQAVTAVQNTFGAAGTGGCTSPLGPVTHPYAVAPSTGAALQVCGTPGDTLVVLQLPFGSFVPTQPPVDVTITATLSNLADVGTPLNIRARGGYQYGATPLSDWCCAPFDATILSHPSTDSSTWPASPITPSLFTVTKTYSGPENETATGPNFFRQYTVTVDIANGQTLTNLDVTDTLPNNMQFVSFDGSTPASTPVSTPSTVTPGGTLTRRFASVTGTTGTSDATMTFTFYIPRLDASSSAVINAATGVAATSLNNASATANWTPIDPRDVATPVNGVCPSPCHTLTDRSIATQKSVAVVTDTSPTGISPGDTLQYTLTFQISDFFAFQNVVLTDVLSDGQRLDSTFAPLITFTGNPSSSDFGPVAIAADNVDVTCNYTGGPGVECDVDDPGFNTGRTTIDFRVSDEIFDRAGTDRVIGGCIDPVNGSNPPDCTYNNGATTGTIVFRTRIQQNYSDAYPSGDPSVDHGDILDDNLTITAAVLNPTTSSFTPTGSNATDTSSAQVTIAFGGLTKGVYAINTTVCSPCTTEINNGVNPGDTVTFRLSYVQPASDFEETVLTDFLPLPIFDADEFSAATFNNTLCGVPAAGNACLGPADTFNALTTPIPPPPILGFNSAANTVSFTYVDYDNTSDITSTIDVLFTVTVTDEPFADGLFLTNQANSSEGTTQNNSTSQNVILQFRVNEPVLLTSKSAVSTDNPSGAFTPALGIPFIAPGTAGIPFTAPINSSMNPRTAINSDLRGVDAGDLIKFAIVLENTGRSANGAFDISIRDTLQPGYVIPSTGPGLNLQVYRGDGAAMSYVDLGGGIFGSGIRLTDDTTTTPPTGACQVHNLTNGLNIVIITYDLQLDNAITLGDNIINTATLFNYASRPGGDDFTNPLDLFDTATVYPVSAPVKSVDSTSESHTSEAGAGTTASPRQAAVGEIVRFRIEQRVPEGITSNFRLHDQLPAGLIFLDDGTAQVALVANGVITSSTLAGAGLNVVGDETTVGAIDPTFVLPDTAVSATDSTAVANYAADDNDTYASGTDVYFKFGDLTNPDRDTNVEYVVVEFNAVVANIAGNVAGTNRDNVASARFGASLTDGANSNSIRVRVVTPSVTMGKSIVSLPSPIDAGGVVTYQIVVSNGVGTNVTTAFDVQITDALPAQLTLNLPVTITLNGGAAGVTDASAGSNVDVTIASIPAGGSVTLDYTATINSTVTPEQIISNSSVATWTSLPGPNGTSPNATGSTTPGASGATNGERNGSGTAPNTYRATDSESFTSAAAAITKQLTATSASHTTGSNVAIGEEITFDILLTLPEGTTPADTVVDDLPTGLEVVTGTEEIITSASAVGSVLTADFGGTIGTQLITPVPGDGGSLTFAFANIVVTGDNDTTNNTIQLRFRARVTNVVGNQAGITISNEASNQVGAGAPTASNRVDVTVVEPSITFGKTIVSTPSPLDAGGIVQYRITYANATGATSSTAMDVRITDALAAALLLPSTSAPDLVITASAGVGAITNNSTTSNIDITIASVPPGESVTIDFSPVIQDTITPGQIIDNVGNSIWTSLSGTVTGERTGADGPGGALDDYAAATSTQSFTAGTPTITKQLTATSASHTAGSSVTIGEIVTYSILLTFPEGTTPSDTVVDDLPTGLAVVTGSSQVITTAAASGGLLAADFSGTIGAQIITPVPGDGGSVTFDFTNVVVAGDNDTTNNTLLMRFDARVTDVAGNVGFPVATTVSNEATNQVGSGTPTSSNTVDVTVVEPRPVITKAFTPVSGTVNDVIRVTLTYENTGTSNAYDVVITDALDSTRFTSLTPVTTPAGWTFTQTPGPGIVTVQYAADAGTAVAPGATVVFEFDITLTSSVVPGELLPNTANVTRTTTLDSSTSDGDDANERNTTTSGSATLTVNATDLSIDKSHVGNFTLGVNGVFTIRVRNVSANAATGTITVTDTLPPQLTFVSASGTDWTCANVGQSLTCTHPGPAFGGVTLPDILVTVTPNANGTFDNTANVSITGTETSTANNSDTDSVTVGSTNPDLTIAKTHSGNFTVGSVGAFSLTVTNVGAAATSAAITVTDTLPPELDYVSASGAGWTCAYASATRTVTCTHPGPLFPPASLPVITLNVAPNTATGSPFTNNATVLTSGDTNAGNNNASDSVVVNSGPVPDLTIAKTHTGNFVVGTNGSFTLTVSNVGAAATVGTITVTDTLPAELTFVSASGAGWTCANVGQAVTCTHPGPLGVGASLPAITVTVNPNTATGSPFTNTAAVSTPGDGNSTNNTSADSVIVTAGVAPDLIVTKTHTGNFVAGAPGIFTLAVTNTGTGPTTGTITLTDTLPAELDYVSASGAGWTCNLTTAGPPNDIVTCTHPGPLAVGATLSVDLTVNPLTDLGSPFVNDVSVSTPGESNTTNNSDTDSVVVTAAPAPDLTISKTHVGNFTVGANNSFTLAVRNVGSGPTTAAITVTDTLPAGLTFVSVSGTGWDCSATVAPNVSCTHPGPVTAGGALPDLTLTVTPTTPTPPAILNTAAVATTGDSNSANDSSTDSVTVAPAPGPDLTIVKSHLSNFVVGVNGVYTFRVSNVGSVATTAIITVTDTLQTGLAFVSASSTDTNWDCSGSVGVNVICAHPGPLAAGASLADLNLTVSVGAAAVGTFNNVATVATTGDTNSSNDASVDSTTVTATPQPDLAISKSHTGSFAIGTRGVYTIRVRNVGSQATTGAITVTDTLQTGLTLVSAAGANWFCGSTGQTVTCNYLMPPATAPNPGETLPDITLTVDVGLAALGVFNNVAAVLTPGDTNPANDTAADQTIVPFTVDLSLTKAVNNGAPNVGDTVVFMVTVANAGPHDATNVTVSDALPGGLAFVSATPSQGTYSSGAGLWTVGAIPASNSATLILSASVTGSSAMVNTAQVSAANQVDVDSTPGNNAANEDDQASVAIAPVQVSGASAFVVVDPAIAKRLPIENAQIGEAIEYIITVTNPNPSPVSNVVVVDPLSDLVNFIGASLTQGTFSYDAAAHTVTFDIGTLAAGQVVEIRIQTVVNERGQPPFELCNEADMRVDGQLRGKSGVACAHILPGIIPATGNGPGPRERGLQWVLWLLAAAFPAMVWLGWTKLRRRQS